MKVLRSSNKVVCSCIQGRQSKGEEGVFNNLGFCLF